MKSTGLLIAAILLALAGATALGAGVLERNLAEAQQYLSTQRYADAERALDEAQRYADYAKWIPRAGVRIQRDLAARRAAIRYWRHEYAAILPREADPVGAVDPANTALQLVVANAAFRSSQSRPATRPAAIQALDEAIGSYMSLLRNDTWHADAAFNYEYLIRLRDEVARGRKTLARPEQDDADLGMPGAPARVGDVKKFEIYVPLEGSERTESGDAGKSGSIQKKG